MIGWDILNAIFNGFPPVAAALFTVIAGVILLIGFSRNGMDFIKHGFKQNILEEMISKLATKEDIAGLRTEIDGIKTEIDGIKIEMDEFRGELAAIKVNHFGHLKNFLTELTSILVDKGVINNENKARLDNHLRGM